MGNLQPLKLFISSNCEIGGPQTFVLNFKRFFENDKRLLFVRNIKKSDLVLLIGENYIIKDLLLGFILRKKLFLRLDGRRLNFLSKVLINRQGNEGFIKYLKSIFLDLKVIFAYFLVNKVIYQTKYTRKQWVQFERFLVKDNATIINPCALFGNNKYNNLTNIHSENFQLNPYRFIVISKGFIHRSYLLDSAYRVLNKIGIKILVFGSYDLELEREFPLIKFFGYVQQDIYKKYLEKCLAFLCIENNACCPNALIEAQIIGKPIIGPNNGSLPEMCPLPNIQLLKNSTKIDIELESLINDYLNNYEIWKNKSIFFSKKTFGSQQYEKYFEFFLK